MVSAKKTRIVIVEDEFVIAMDLQRELENLSYEVVGVASSETEALKAVQENKPDLILMDVNLGESSDGIEIAKKIRTHYDTPVVYLTAYSDEPTLQRAKLTEPYGYLLKPFEARELHIVIEMAKYKHAAESALKKANEELEAKVQERTKELSEAKILAEKNAQIKTEFLATMSHEIRTPLTAILGFTDLLSDPHVSEADKNQYLEIINRHGKGLARLIDDILDISRIEAGGLDIENVDFSLPALIHEVVSLLGVRAAEKGIQLRVKNDEPIPEMVNSDPTRIRQILMNIVGNAIKFTSKGSVSITVKVSNLKEHDSKAQIHFLVTDTGLGIDSQTQERLFKAFSQADSSMTRKFGGSGLGLMLSRRLARALGGDVQLEKSEFGKGSTFAITIPTSLPKNLFSNATTHLLVDQDHPIDDSNEFSELHVLVAEDSPDMQTLTKKILSKKGIAVDVVPNGQLAVEAALTHNYDAIFMDIQMPVMDGLSATLQLRRKGSRTPIIAMTAHAMKEDKEKCLRAGCNDHISKPISSADLFQLLARHMGKRPASKAVEQS